MACGSDVETDGTTTGTTTTDTAGSDEADNEALAACGTEACPEGFAQRIEGGDPFTINFMACIVEAIRDRKPGLYRVTLDHTFGNGAEVSEYAIFVTASGEVEVGVRRFDEVDGASEESWDPTERCTLKPQAFFEDCLTAVNAGDQIDATPEAFACIYPESGAGDSQELPWFEGCEAQAPTCE